MFVYFLLFVITQRCIELIIAKYNEEWMKKRGAIEFGQSHYPLIVMVHSLFFVVLTVEVVIFAKGLSPYWYFLLPLFLLTQVIRVWALSSLGRFWNTKIIVLPNAKVVTKGPYRWLKHPNYTVVAMEFLIMPLLFQAYYTALVFTLLNFFILAIRIPAEEEALKALTKYEEAFPLKNDEEIGKI